MSRSNCVLMAGTALLLAVAGTVFAAAKSDAEIRINQIQVIGSHNSYHAGLTPGVAKLLQATNPKAFEGLDYSHADLTTQFNHGIRQVELDIYSDVNGARFAHPFGATLNAGGAGAFDPQGVMLKPGFKVMHVQDIDYISNCQPFAGCLREIRTWSHAHHNHVPIFVLVETKTQQPIAAVPGMVAPEPFTPAVMDALDAEIRSVFTAHEMITPDQVRGHHATLPEAIQHGGWPTLKSARGKVVFLLDQQNVTATYVAGHPALAGRVLFTNSQAGQPDAAFIEQTDRLSRGDRRPGQDWLSGSNPLRCRYEGRAHGRHDPTRQGAAQRGADREHRLPLVRTLTMDEFFRESSRPRVSAVQSHQRAAGLLARRFSRREHHALDLPNTIDPDADVTWRDVARPLQAVPRLNEVLGTGSDFC